MQRARRPATWSVLSSPPPDNDGDDDVCLRLNVCCRACSRLHPCTLTHDAWVHSAPLITNQSRTSERANEQPRDVDICQMHRIDRCCEVGIGAALRRAALDLSVLVPSRFSTLRAGLTFTTCRSLISSRAATDRIV